MNTKNDFFEGMSKSELAIKIQTVIQTYEYDQEFSFPLLSDLILKKHYYCSRHNLFPVLFRKKPNARNNYYLEAHFPAHGWHRTSWYECVYPKNHKKILEQRLRYAVYPQIIAYKNKHPICEHCGHNPSEEVDHISPQFNTIIENAMSLTPTMNLEVSQQKMDWLTQKPLLLPEDHPSIEYVLKIHECALLQAVCRPCHREITIRRRMIDDDLRYAA
ncbi:hypothetical protein MMIC_P1577 [Mariprofundus micogutta]|uniref:HNH nuclease domain-containing protein n=1 Tax=Mariprofundus micogutta TaxID=1921010 RepID=A0A1L8CNV5_9PROT|nr:hypothetical protein [Mariprofundus micogutta]GAV20605.1 hypothetical protein MMIC_P1577 [Mariprofundus micogutta]